MSLCFFSFIEIKVVNEMIFLLNIETVVFKDSKTDKSCNNIF